MKSPAFQFYPADFLADKNTIVMTTVEIGAYWLLLMVCWQENGLPDDLEELARVSRLPVRQFTPLWDRRIQRCFQKRESDGKWTHKRLEKERYKQSEYRTQQSEAGKRGARKRWRGHSTAIATLSGGNGSAIDSPMAKNSSSSSSSSSSSTSVVPFPNGNGVQQPQDFSLWKLALGKLMATGTEESAARSFLGKLAKDYGKTLISQCVTEMLASDPIDPKSYLVDLLKRKKLDSGDAKLTDAERATKDAELAGKMGYAN